MNPKERKRQEAMFELMTSESSYLRSLNVLVDCYKSSPELRATVTSTEYHHLFSNIDAVRKACWRFHHALSKRRKSSSVVINDVCDIVLEFVKAGTFAPYVTYCSNEIYQQRVLLRLMKENQEFVRVLRRLEKNEQCAGLPLHSFLLLPMQRITRIPLLIDTIRQRCEISSPYYSIASEALKETTSLVKTCNEQARSLERTEEMIQLQTQLEFKCSRSFALVSASRYVVKRGPLLKVSEDVVFGFRRLTKQEIYLFLFNDVILVTKRKNDESYSVTDYCYKERLKSRDVINDPFSFVIIMERTQDGQRIELKLEADKPNGKSRWMSALSRNKSFGQPISKEAMQVLIVKSIRAEEPDMISLKNMDVCVVLYTTSDGWIYGERMSDGCRGWFSSGGAKEILNSKVREQNLYRRARLLGQPTVV
ncbi:rho guanine nucleotide exchange factor 26-like [Ciona intestinalis]